MQTFYTYNTVLAVLRKSLLKALSTLLSSSEALAAMKSYDTRNVRISSRKRNVATQKNIQLVAFIEFLAVRPVTLSVVYVLERLLGGSYCSEFNG